MPEIKPFAATELEVVGEYPVCGKNYGWDQFPAPRFNTPITPKENWRRFMDREPFAWVPDVFEDMNVCCPEFVPDNLAQGYVGGLDSFGVPWIPVPNHPELTCFVDPKTQRIDTIEDWRELTFPEVGSWNWNGPDNCYKELSPDRPTCGIMQTGLFERMISVSSYEEAVVSFLESPEDAADFLDAITDFNIQVMEHYHDQCGCSVALMHDDWGTQNSPAFSQDILDEFLIPRVKRIADRAHELSMDFILHSCGNIVDFVPSIIEANVDMWQFNYEAVQSRIVECMRAYGDRLTFHGYIGDVTKFSPDLDAFKHQVQKLYEELGGTGVCSLSILDYEERGIDVRAFCYEEARKVADALFGR